MVNTLLYERKGTEHFNVKFKSGGLLDRLLAVEVYGLRPAEIEWVYIVDEKRNATLDEIWKLCKGVPKPSSRKSK